MNKLHRLLMLIVLMMVSMASFGQEGKVKQLQINSSLKFEIKAKQFYAASQRVL